MSKNKPNSWKEKYPWGAIFLVLSIVTIVLITVYCSLYWMGYDRRGTFGDMFGLANAIFSGLAFGGIIITIILQSRELGFQREELEQTRLVFENQSDTMQLQQFENTFFNLIRNHNQLVKSLDRQNRKGEVTYGIARIREERDDLERDIELTNKRIDEKEFTGYPYNMVDEESILSKMKCFKVLGEDIVLILNFIYQSSIENKEFYYDILYNSLSSDERYLFGCFLEFSELNHELGEQDKIRMQKEYFESEYVLKHGFKANPKVLYIGTSLRGRKDIHPNAISDELQKLEIVFKSFDRKNVIVEEISWGQVNSNNGLVYKVKESINFEDEFRFKVFKEYRDSEQWVLPMAARTIEFKGELRIRHKEGELYKLQFKLSIRNNVSSYRIT